MDTFAIFDNKIITKDTYYRNGYKQGRADAEKELKEKYLDTDAYNEGLEDGRAAAIDEFADYVLNQFTPLFTKEELIKQFNEQLKNNS